MRGEVAVEGSPRHRDRIAAVLHPGTARLVVRSIHVGERHLTGREDEQAIRDIRRIRSSDNLDSNCVGNVNTARLIEPRCHIREGERCGTRHAQTIPVVDRIVSAVDEEVPDESCIQPVGGIRLSPAVYDCHHSLQVH